ncbi:MAG: hypothetical protein GF344_03470 [Chitinivibrionales bacterium]|nr:hypothetical protein [Chitinivibrionales bacterium]MBD3356131.1 hypothetical protein [Chitinivibrionales bacterium]
MKMKTKTISKTKEQTMTESSMRWVIMLGVTMILCGVAVAADGNLVVPGKVTSTTSEFEQISINHSDPTYGGMFDTQQESRFFLYDGDLRILGTEMGDGWYEPIGQAQALLQSDNLCIELMQDAHLTQARYGAGSALLEWNNGYGASRKLSLATGKISFWENGQEKLSLEPNGITANSISCESISIKDWVLTQAPDYVFEPDYELKDLAEVEAFVKQEKHLPDVPSAKEIREKGVDLAQLNMALLKQIEELTLHTIAQQKQIDALNKKLQQMAEE